MANVSNISGASDQNLFSSMTSNQDVSREDFLKLLIAQLQHQDPLNPTENQEFVAELATFSSLEQQTQQTKLLEQMIQAQSNNTTTQALSLIGKDVTAAQTKFFYTKGNDITFDFKTQESGTTTVQILSENGAVVDSQVLSTPNIGEYSFTFDGHRSDGSALPDGVYDIVIGEHTNGEGEKTSLPTYLRGTVEGVNFQDGQPVLLVDGQPVSIQQVNAVFDKRNET